MNDSHHASSRPILLLQLAGTLAVLAWVPANPFKLLALVVLWVLAFGGVSRRELLLWLSAGLLFTSMDAATVHQGVFAFSRPDFLGLPCWEPFMWRWQFTQLMVIWK